MKMRSLKSGCLSVVLLLVLLLSCGCTQHTPPADVSSLPHNDISKVVSAISEVPVTSVPSAEEKSEVSDTAAVSEISVPSQETHCLRNRQKHQKFLPLQNLFLRRNPLIIRLPPIRILLPSPQNRHRNLPSRTTANPLKKFPPHQWMKPL